MKKLVFRKWLKSQGVDVEQFWENCKRKNQGWDYDIPQKRNKLKARDPHKWVVDAFLWKSSKQGFWYWREIGSKWHEEVDKHNYFKGSHKIKFGFGK